AGEHALEVLHADRRLAAQRRREAVARRRIRVQRVVDEVRAIVLLVAEQRGPQATREGRALTLAAQVPVLASRVVDATRQAARQPRAGTPVSRHAPDEAVDVLSHRLGEELVWREQPVAEAAVV